MRLLRLQQEMEYKLGEVTHLAEAEANRRLTILIQRFKRCL